MRKNALKLIALTIIISMFCMIILAGCSKKPDDKEVKDTIKIGYAGPITGGSAEHGNRQMRGAKFAVEEINAAGGINGKMVELVIMDDRADPKEAANIANRYASDPEILAVIGHANSSCTLAGAPIYNNAELLHITTSSSAPAITEAGPYTFRLWNSDAYTARFNVEAMVKAGYKKIAIIYQ